MTAESLTPPFSEKIAVVVRDDLATWQRLNVTSFVVSGVAAAHPHLMGGEYADADGQRYLRLLGLPVLVLEAEASTLAAARERAARRELPIAIFTSAMFETGHDADNRAAVRAVASAALDLVGIGVCGPKNAVDKIVKGARLHP